MSPEKNKLDIFILSSLKNNMMVLVEQTQKHGKDTFKIYLRNI
jgi:hypothetical protein